LARCLAFTAGTLSGCAFDAGSADGLNVFHDSILRPLASVV
jgi:hypothetical protein